MNKTSPNKALPSVRGMAPMAVSSVSHASMIDRMLRQTTEAFGFKEIRLPIVEFAKLFNRSLGEHTDIVTKELYEFPDRNGDLLCLRPEGTASCIRAAIEQGLLRQNNQRLWYMGPMFRHERPQQGRYRQFNQLGVEAFGLQSPYIDVEMLQLTHHYWTQLALNKMPTLEINYLGEASSRATFRQALIDFMTPHAATLSDIDQKRLAQNPLRLLDSKDPTVKNLLTHAPTLIDALPQEEQDQFKRITELLNDLNIPYHVNPHLVRGLDYYNGLVFEWVSQDLGAQGTVCAGGRYDQLVQELGGKPTPSCGFAVGLERLYALVQHTQDTPLDIYWIGLDEQAHQQIATLNWALRQQCPSLSMQSDALSANRNNQLKRAYKANARWAFILDTPQLNARSLIAKPLTGDGGQQIVPFDQLHVFCQQHILSNKGSL